MDISRIPERNEIPVEYTWDLTNIFPGDEAWAAERAALLEMPGKIEAFAGTLGERPGRLLDWLKLSDELGVRIEKLMGYANCKGDQDTADSFYQDVLDDKAFRRNAQPLETSNVRGDWGENATNKQMPWVGSSDPWLFCRVS